MRVTSVLASVAWVIAAALPASSLATTTTQNVTATATAQAACKVTTAALGFSTYDPIIVNKTVDKTASATIGVTCTNGTTPASVVVNSTAGTTQGSSSQMNTTPTNGTALSYTYSLTPPSGGFVTGITHTNNYTLNGTIAHGQNVKAGTYGDTLVASVNF